MKHINKSNKIMKLKTLILLTIVLALFSCTNDESSEIVNPKISFSNNNQVTSFYTEGSFEKPSIDWGGETGTLNLGALITGVSLDASSGIISWTKELSLGEHTIEITATNSAGESKAALVLTNNFEGDFTGGYNKDPNSTTLSDDFIINFNSDGTMQAEDVVVSSIATGTWTRNNDIITIEYTFNGTSFLSIVFELVYNESGAYLEGQWFRGTDTTVTPEGYIIVFIAE